MKVIKDLVVMTAVLAVLVGGIAGVIWFGVTILGGMVEDPLADSDESPAIVAIEPDEEAMGGLRGAAVEPPEETAEDVYNLGVAAWNAEKIDEAVRHFERAVQLAPDEPALRQTFASALAAAGRDHEAAAAYRALLEKASFGPAEAASLEAIIVELEQSAKAKEEPATEPADGEEDEASGILAVLGKTDDEAPGGVVGGTGGLGVQGTSEETEPAAAEPEPSGLDMAVVSKVVEARKKKLLVCFKRARKRGKVAAGHMLLAVSWTVQPGGRAADIRVISPSQLRKTTIPACIAKRMRRWAFPKSAAPTTVKEYPVALRLP